MHRKVRNIFKIRRKSTPTPADHNALSENVVETDQVTDSTRVSPQSDVTSLTGNQELKSQTNSEMMVNKDSIIGHPDATIEAGSRCIDKDSFGLTGESTPNEAVTPLSESISLQQIAEFYHHFPDLHTEVRIMIVNNAVIYLLGTNHADPQCPIDVADIMRTVRPQITLVELCAWRACGCRIHKGNIFQTKPQFTFQYLRRVISQIGFLPAMIFFTDAFNEHTAFDRELLEYGGEFAMAAHICQELGDCKIVLADREIPITVRRQASAMSNWRGIRVTFLVLLSLMFKSRMSTFLQRGHELIIRDPHFYQVVVLERDIFLTHMIQRTASLLFAVDQPQIVAVVGQGHLNGIQSLWGKIVTRMLPLILNPEVE